MCRFTLYLGPPVKLQSLLVDPAHSLILQSFRSAERAEPLNGDGFGVGWYAPDLAPRPALFRSITPAWNNMNLRTLAGVVASPCVMAHVRAASPGMPVTEVNCHPFSRDNFLFMHNGHVGAFRGIRRALLRDLSEEAFHMIQGSTDSEHLFALFLDEMRATGPEQPHALAHCLNRVVWRVIEMVRALGGDHASYLNLAVADGDRAAACRFTSDPTHPPESLYLIEREIYRPIAMRSPDAGPSGPTASFVVSSERLTDDSAWTAVEPNHVVSLQRDGSASTFAMRREGLVAA